MKSFINANIKQEQISSSELIAFIKVELTVAFYGCSPGRFFDPANAAMYPTASSGMSHQRYFAILGSLQVSASIYTDPCGRWNPPMQHDRHLASAMELV